MFAALPSQPSVTLALPESEMGYIGKNNHKPVFH